MSHPKQSVKKLLEERILIEQGDKFEWENVYKTNKDLIKAVLPVLRKIYEDKLAIMDMFHKDAIQDYLLELEELVK